MEKFGGKDFMNRTRNAMKKILMLFVAFVFVFCGATEAFADEPEAGTGMLLEENKQEGSFIGGSGNSGVNFSALEKQITVAIGLNEHDYTKESWSNLQKALNAGVKIFGSKESTDQKTVDEAVFDLETAIASLSRVDYSKLEKAINQVYNKSGENAEFHEIWNKINSAVERAKPLLLSGDQAAADNAAAEIEALLAELEGLGVISGEPEIVIKEVEVTVPPSDDFCNIPGHKVWPVLFAISAVINAALAAVIYYIFSKMKNTADEIPLVKYDIDDDFGDVIDDFDDEPEDEAEGTSDEDED